MRGGRGTERRRGAGHSSGPDKLPGSKRRTPAVAPAAASRAGRAPGRSARGGAVRGSGAAGAGAGRGLACVELGVGGGRDKAQHRGLGPAAARPQVVEHGKHDHGSGRDTNGDLREWRCEPWDCVGAGFVHEWTGRASGRLRRLQRSPAPAPLVQQPLRGPQAAAPPRPPHTPRRRLRTPTYAPCPKPRRPAHRKELPVVGVLEPGELHARRHALGQAGVVERAGGVELGAAVVEVDAKDCGEGGTGAQGGTGGGEEVSMAVHEAFRAWGRHGGDARWQ